MIWNEHVIANALATQTFTRKAVVITPNCFWTGYECDLLVIEHNMRIIDVEIKISRADLKADAGKDKWWRCMLWTEARDKGRDVSEWNPWEHRERREWPVKVWKHYYAMPEDIWKPELLDSLPSPASGVIVLTERQRAHHAPVIEANVIRRATPNRDAMVLTPIQVLDVARLTNLRYWDARQARERAQQLLDQMRLLQAGEAAI